MNYHNEIYIWQLVVDAYAAHKVEDVGEELKTVAQQLKKNHPFTTLLKAPGMTLKMKQSLIKEAFESQISPLLIDFFIVLIEKNLFDEIGNLADIYDQVVEKYLESLAGIISGEVYSAIAMTENQMTQLNVTFSKKLNKQVRFKNIIDPTLIGGYKVNINNQMYDDTIKTRLKQLRKTLKDEKR